MIVKRVTTIYIDRKHELFGYCDAVTSKANDLSNAARFRQRQVYTSSGKEPCELTDNERGVLEELTRHSGSDFVGRKRTGITYAELYRTMHGSKNPDYHAEGLPRQSAQWILKRAVADFDSFFAASRAYAKDPSSFAKRPELPGYKRKGGRCTVGISNQDCKLTVGGDGVCRAGLPFAKKTPLCVGRPAGRLKEARIVPTLGRFKIEFVFDVEIPDVVPAAAPKRVVGVDFGVDNLMAVANNVGMPCLLYKGGVAKSVNRLYNKELARIMSEETTKPDCPKKRDGSPKFVQTAESLELTFRRGCQMKDLMLKTACRFVAWCVENRIDAIALGTNAGWKQNVSIGKRNDQNFVQIPFAYLRAVIRYKAEAAGIVVVEQEESYTSKASFLDGDYIPTYGVDDERAKFSGRRRPTRYAGMYDPKGFRGLYVSKNGTIVNSDLNGAANILRKAYPDAFEVGTSPDFAKVEIIRRPDGERIATNRAAQLAHANMSPSKSKARRLAKKKRSAPRHESNPTGIGLRE